MYKLKYIFGNTVKYQGKFCKVIAIRFSTGGVMYKLTGVYQWVKESEI